MPRRNKRDREQYVYLSYPMLHSLAWRSLSGAAVKVWLELRTRFNGGNNGRLRLSLDEAARILQLGKATVMRALKELEAKGFVKLTRRGQWYGHRASEWAVTDKGIDGNLDELGQCCHRQDQLRAPWARGENCRWRQHHHRSGFQG
jgi:DNA-binding MarR family transcriptional regulator